MQVHGDALRFGVHSGQLLTAIEDHRRLWRTAEAAGFDWISVFDHLRPPPTGATGACFEGTTLLAALAGETSRVRCGLLVMSVAFRHPGLVANIAATLDHLSDGRIELGLGAGGDDLAHDEYGMPLPSMAHRLEMLGETCEILRQLWTENEVTFEGRHYRLQAAHLQPKPVQDRLPITIGGTGDQVLRVVARHADVWNAPGGDVATYRRQVGVLSEHCADLGRDQADIRRSVLFRTVLGPTEAEALDRCRQQYGDAARLGDFLVVGTPEQCVEALGPFLELGAGDLLLGLRNPFDWQTLELMASEVAPALRG
jgi:alkanesulfonate monooxygenase SsuD/methylene tetrahydromethanopterin reductase-like flavin-dependent oxidoreductase (luciferase family)